MTSMRRQAGLTIVELMVALVITLLLLAGLVTIFASMRTSFSTTQQLNQLVNQQRLASTVMSDTLATAGFYPISNRSVMGRYQTPADAFPVKTHQVSLGGRNVNLDFSTAGQVVYGTGTTTAPAGDAIAVRMMTLSGASPLNCQGGTNSNVFPNVDHVISVFWLDSTRNQLECTLVIDDGTNVTTTAMPLVGGERLPTAAVNYGGVDSLVAAYGIDTNGSGSVDRYMSASALSASSGQICPDPVTGAGHASSCWPYVRSIRVQLAFKSALDTGRAFNLTRTITLQNAVGRNIEPSGS